MQIKYSSFLCNAVQNNSTLHCIQHYNTERRSDFGYWKHAPYFALMGELSGIPSENLGKNWPALRGQYNATNYSSHGKILIIIFPQAEWRVEETQPPKEWPQNGAVKFSNYGTRYREGLDLVVKDININIKGGEKVNTHPKVTFPQKIISYICFIYQWCHKRNISSSVGESHGFHSSISWPSNTIILTVSLFDTSFRLGS